MSAFSPSPSFAPAPGANPSHLNSSGRGIGWRSSLLALGLLTLTGCGSMSSAANEEDYQPPPASASVAHLRGSSIDEGGLFGSAHRGFVNMIDLRAVPDAADRWNDPIALTPGQHTIVAEYRYSNFMSRAYLNLDAKPGASYELMIKNGRDTGDDGRQYNDFWIIDSGTGKPVTPTLRRQVTGGKTGTIFYNNK